MVKIDKWWILAAVNLVLLAAIWATPWPVSKWLVLLLTLYVIGLIVFGRRRRRSGHVPVTVLSSMCECGGEEYHRPDCKWMADQDQD